LFAGEPPQEGLALEAHDATKSGRRHRGVVLRPPEHRPLVHLQHPCDLLSSQKDGRAGDAHVSCGPDRAVRGRSLEPKVSPAVRRHLIPSGTLLARMSCDRTSQDHAKSGEPDAAAYKSSINKRLPQQHHREVLLATFSSRGAFSHDMRRFASRRSRVNSLSRGISSRPS
jgi:hypothetical protein